MNYIIKKYITFKVISGMIVLLLLSIIGLWDYHTTGKTTFLKFAGLALVGLIFYYGLNRYLNKPTTIKE